MRKTTTTAPERPRCRGPGCTHEALYRDGLCGAHHRQAERGVTLRELRGPRGLIGDSAKVTLGGLRVSARVLERLRAVRAESVTGAARLVLEAWAAGLPLPGE